MTKLRFLDSMFWQCFDLETVDLSIFEPENAEDISSMFFQCHKLKYVDLSNFKTSNINNMEELLVNSARPLNR